MNEQKLIASLVHEATELLTNIQKLDVMITNYESYNVSPTQYDLLKRQYSIMSDYHQILDERVHDLTESKR